MQDLGKISAFFRSQAIPEGIVKGERAADMQHKSCKCRANLWVLTLGRVDEMTQVKGEGFSRERRCDS